MQSVGLLWVEFKCPLCGKDLDDDKTMANFLVCGDSSHGLLRFFTGDGCYFTTNEQVAEDLMKRERGFTLSILRNSLGIRQLISNSRLVIRQESLTILSLRVCSGPVAQPG